MLLKIIARIILFFIGWHPPTERDYCLAHKYPRALLVYPHTTYWDGALFLLYRAAYPTLIGSVYALLGESIYNRWPGFFGRLGFISVPTSHKPAGGTVQLVANHLKDRETYRLLISPIGALDYRKRNDGQRPGSPASFSPMVSSSMVNGNFMVSSSPVDNSPMNSDRMRPWRSGYYHIAKTLNCPLGVVGLDYERRCIVIGRAHYEHLTALSASPEANLAEVEGILQKDMAEIVPLYPQNTYPVCRDHNPYNLFAIDPILLTSNLSVLVFIGVIYSYGPAINVFPWNRYWALLVTIIAGIFSYLYHWYGEASTPIMVGSKITVRQADMLTCRLCYLYHLGYRISRLGLEIVITDKFFWLLHGLALAMYCYGSGREHYGFRTPTYALNHSLFHIAVCTLGIYSVMA